MIGNNIVIKKKNNGGNMIKNKGGEDLHIIGPFIEKMLIEQIGMVEKKVFVMQMKNALMNAGKIGGEAKMTKGSQKQINLFDKDEFP